MAITSTCRADLFDLVWSEALGKVGARFGVSDVAVAKACKKHSIPLPKQGHWAREEKNRDRQPELPPSSEYWGDMVYFQPPPPKAQKPSVPGSQAPVELVTELAKCRPIVRATHRVLKKESEEKGLLVKPRNEVALDVRVSKPSLDRALLIFDAIIRATEARGGKWEVTAARTILHALGGSIDINMLESRTQSFVPSEYFRNSKDQKLTGNGELTLRSGNSGSRVAALRDSSSGPLETKINDATTALLEMCVRSREAEEDWARRNALYEQKLEAERQTLRAKQEEEIRLKRLIVAAHAYDDARLIRELCRVTETAEGLSDERRQWLSWARSQAEKLDPLARPGTPSELKVTDEDVWDSQRNRR